MRIQNRWVAAFFAVLILATLGCDKDGPGGTNPGGGGIFGGGQTGPGQHLVPEAVTCEARCWTPAPSVGMTPRVGISRVAHGDLDRVELINRTQNDLTLVGWYIVINGVSAPLQEVSVVDNGTISFHLGRTGEGTGSDLYLSNPDFALGAEGEIAFFASADIEDAGDLRAFVRWGSPSSSDIEEMADDLNLWEEGTFVLICDGNSEFAAVGEMKWGRGYRSMEERCFDPDRGSGYRRGR